MHIPAKKLALALSIVEVVILAMHALVYSAVARFFIAGERARIIAAIVFFLLALTFISALLAGRKFKSRATRVFYKASVAWFGSLYFLILASILSWIFSFLSFSSMLAGIFFSIAIILTIYAIFNANHVNVSEISVRIPNLPERWTGRRIAWASDLHLGHVYGTGLTKKVTALTNASKSDLCIIGGDLFDGMPIDAETAIAPLKNIAAKFGTYFITGNHEEYGNEAAYLEAVRAAGITTLVDESVDLEGLRFIGVDYHTSHVREEYASILKRLTSEDAPTVLFKHEPNNLDVAESAGVALQISGHTHRGQMRPFDLLARRAYRGFEYGLKMHGRLAVLVSSGAGTWGPPLRFGTRSEIAVVTLGR